MSLPQHQFSSWSSSTTRWCITWISASSLPLSVIRGRLCITPWPYLEMVYGFTHINHITCFDICWICYSKHDPPGFPTCLMLFVDPVPPSLMILTKKNKRSNASLKWREQMEQHHRTFYPSLDINLFPMFHLFFHFFPKLNLLLGCPVRSANLKGIVYGRPTTAVSWSTPRNWRCRGVATLSAGYISCGDERYVRT